MKFSLFSFHVQPLGDLVYMTAVFTERFEQDLNIVKIYESKHVQEIT